MKKADAELILKSTDGIFSASEVPQLYVEIQTLRAKLERKICYQVSFNDALYSWMEEIYRPIMEGINDYRLEKRLGNDRTVSEIYFDLYDEAEKNDFASIKECIEAYLKANRKGFRAFLARLSA